MGCHDRYITTAEVNKKGFGVTDAKQLAHYIYNISHLWTVVKNEWNDNNEAALNAAAKELAEHDDQDFLIKDIRYDEKDLSWMDDFSNETEFIVASVTIVDPHKQIVDCELGYSKSYPNNTIMKFSGNHINMSTVLTDRNFTKDKIIESLREVVVLQPRRAIAKVEAEKAKAEEEMEQDTKAGKWLLFITMLLLVGIFVFSLYWQ